MHVWIDDLRLAPASLTYEGKAITPTVPREELEKTFGGCTAMPARIGGAFEKCHDGGLYVGHGMGDFLQIRVRPKAFPFDDACAIATDDGSAVELSPKDRSSIFKKTLNLTELSKYWHVDKPGRDPLRIVKTPLVAQELDRSARSDERGSRLPEPMIGRPCGRAGCRQNAPPSQARPRGTIIIGIGLR